MSNFPERRRATEQLAVSIRAMADAAAETAVDPSVLDDVRAQIDELAARLRAEVHDGAYSGLVEQPVDYSVVDGPMPLNPIVGRCNPTRPDVQLQFADGEVVGTARFTRRFTGPPGFTHGGITAMLADHFSVLELDRITVKGRTAASPVFTALAGVSPEVLAEHRRLLAAREAGTLAAGDPLFDALSSALPALSPYYAIVRAERAAGSV